MQYTVDSLVILFEIKTHTMLVNQNYKIVEEEKMESFLEILSDRYSRKIIESTLYRPKSAIEIAKETGTPISTVYRRIQMLHDNKLLSTTGDISDDGKKFFLYKSRISAIQTTYQDGQMQVMITPNKKN